MEYWSGYLIFNDKLNKLKFVVKYNFIPLFTYKDLYTKIDNIFEAIGFEKINYSQENIVFKLTTYMEEPVKIIDWSTFILDQDKIEVIFYDPKKWYYELYTEKGKKIFRTNKLSLIYDDIYVDRIIEPLLLYIVDDTDQKRKLVDVIDNPKRMYNELVNRMIKRGWY